MGNIVRLDDQLSNKIAAGEVVERPASVVKELVENAVDARASRIEIDIEEGGLTRIKVVDDGDGILQDDCVPAFRRHATSKIGNERDLFHIRTLGFRGEALPSIASVSHMEMKTSTGNEPGTHMILQGGEIIENKSSNSRKGTEIIVSQLFFNTPARLKHLKTVHTELGNITDTIYRIALAYPDVSFRLVHNGKRTFQTNGSGDIRQVIAAIYGVNTAKKMVPIQNESIDFTVSGWVARPEITRASRQHMSIFMNGRYIRNYPLSRAILEGFHTLLPIRRYPIAMIDIHMDPTLIDVNVHPSKLEVRLSKEKELCGLVERAIKESLRKLQLIPETPVVNKTDRSIEQQKFSFDNEAKESQIQSGNNDTKSPFITPWQVNSNSDQKISYQEELTHEPESKYDTGGPDTYEKDDAIIQSPFDQGNKNDERPPSDGEYRIPTLYPIGQMQGTYILAHNENGLYIIDQHAAQERIKYEYYREKVGEIPSEVQELLMPLTFEFSSAESTILEEHIEDLKSVGIFLEPFGTGTYIVRSHPGWFPEGFEKETIEEIIYQVIEEREINIKKLREDAAILMSCKRSIKANHHLRKDEIFALLESLRKSIDPFTCPHGRPILIHFSTYDMEKMFKRVM